MYKISFYEKAKKQLKKIPKQKQNRILAYIERIKIRPHSHVKRLQGTKYFSGRVGDYRLILDIKNKQLIIFVVELGHRKNIYKK
jgi:mRNA interferase RelE/StbE